MTSFSTRARTRTLLACLALAASSPLAHAQVTPTNIFHNSFGATPVPAASRPTSFLQWAALHWTPRPDAPRYRVLRSASSAGPWVVDHDVAGGVDTVKRLPPATAVYFRVVALTLGKGQQWVGIDTTSPVIVVSENSAVRSAGTSATDPWASIRHLSCTVPTPGTVSFTWDAVPEANAYRVNPFVSPSHTALQQLFTKTASLVQPNVPGGTYEYRIYPEYDIQNWPGPGQTLTLYGPMGASSLVTVAAGRTSC